MLVIGIMAGSCGKMDSTYYEFIKDGERVYAGRADSLKAFAGMNRVKLSWILAADPMITKCKVYWIEQGTRDSLEVAVNRTSNVDTVEVIIDGLPEDSYNFTVYTVDSEGNSSVASEVIGYVYGENYKSSLQHRVLRDVDLSPDGQVLTLDWYPIHDGVGTRLSYQDRDGQPRQLELPNEVESLVIDDMDITVPFTYQSRHLPEDAAIDTFANDPATVEIIPPVETLKTPHFEANHQYGYIRDEEQKLFDFASYPGFTVQLRMRTPPGLQRSTTLLGNKDWRSGGNPGWLMAPNGKKWRFNGGGGRRVDLNSSGPDLDDNRWHVLAMTVDHQTNQLRLFQDGALVGSTDVSGVTWTVNSINRLMLGDDITGEGRVRESGGSIFSLADIKVWNVAVDEAVMREMGASCVTDPVPEQYKDNLIGWWLGTTEGAALEDLSGQGNDMLLTEQARGNWMDHKVDFCNERIGTTFVVR